MNRTLKYFVVAALIPIAALCADNASRNAARWQVLIAHLPAPPVTLEQAASAMAADSALQKSRREYHADMNVLYAGAGASASGVPGGTGVRDLAKRMENAPPDQQMALAMQYAMQVEAGAPQGIANRQAEQALGNASRYIAARKQRMLQALTEAKGDVHKLQTEYAGQHKTVDAAQYKAYDDCPHPPVCGDRTNCSPDASCVSAVNALLPSLMAQHRRIAQAELSAESMVYARAFAEVQPILVHAATLYAAAEDAGASTSGLRAIVFSPISRRVSDLQELDWQIVARACFWQGIRARPVPPTYFKSMVPAFYRAATGDAPATPPDALPAGW